MSRGALALLVLTFISVQKDAVARPDHFSNGRHTMVVTPADGLTAVQDVVVRGEDWPAGQLLRVGQCPRKAPPEDAPDPAACVELGRVTTDAVGTFSVDVSVTRTLETHRVRDGSPVSYTCAPTDDCFIHVNNWFTQAGQTNVNRFQTPQLWAEQSLGFAP
jgi:hypothetical protein